MNTELFKKYFKIGLTTAFILSFFIFSDKIGAQSLGTGIGNNAINGGTLPETIVTETPKASTVPKTQQTTSGLSVPFGGLILERQECNCEPPAAMITMNEYVTKSTKKIKILPPSPSRLYIYQNNFKPQRFALGTLDLGGVCKIRVSKDCVDIPVYGVINSMPGAASSGMWGLEQNAPFSGAASQPAGNTAGGTAAGAGAGAGNVAPNATTNSGQLGPRAQQPSRVDVLPDGSTFTTYPNGDYTLTSSFRPAQSGNINIINSGRDDLQGIF